MRESSRGLQARQLRRTVPALDGDHLDRYSLRGLFRFAASRLSRGESRPDAAHQTNAGESGPYRDSAFET